MDEYLSDKEQLERLRQWWRENGWFLIGGVAIGLLVLYGYRQYFAYQDRQAEAASLIYDEVKKNVEDGKTTEAEATFERLRAAHRSNAYTQQAALLLARAEIVSDPDKAVEHLRVAMNESSDPDLAMVARLRLARVLAYREQHDEALKLLDVPSPGQFAGQIGEIKGDIHVARGETDAARTAYLEAMVASGAEVLDRSFLQMKLADLPSPSPNAESAPADVQGNPVTPVPTPPAAEEGA